jgi:hypothetical protein
MRQDDAGHQHRPGDDDRAAAHAIDEKAGRHGGKQSAQRMHDDHQGSDAEAGIEGFREYRYRRCGDAVAEREDERWEI